MVSFTNVVLAAGLASTIAAAPFAMIAASVATSFIKRDDGLTPGEFSFLEDRAVAQGNGNSKQNKNNQANKVSPAAPAATSAGASGNGAVSVEVQFKGCVASMKKNKPTVKKEGKIVTISNLNKDCTSAIKAYNARPDIKALQGKQGTAELKGSTVVLTNMPANVIDALDG